MSFLLELAMLADWDVNALIVRSGPAALIAFTQVRQQGAEVLTEQPSFRQGRLRFQAETPVRSHPHDEII
jgi:hypothetical protein